MLIDAIQDTFDDLPRYDICIVGGGAAGIALAMEFEKDSSKRVCLIEAGGLEFDPDTQDLYAGESIGFPYADLDAARLRYLGGSTNHWGGYNIRFSRNSFERRDWVPGSGWPISSDDVTPYYERARKFLGLPKKADWDPGFGWPVEGFAKHYDLPPLKYEFDDFYQSGIMIRPVRLGQAFKHPLKDAAHIDVLLNSNVVDINLDDTGAQATGVEVRTLTGKAFTVNAKQVVLAAGGLEIPRLLLSATKVQQDGIGNGHGLVGRYFSDHFDISPGKLIPSDPGVEMGLYERKVFSANAASVVVYEVSEEAQARHGLIPTSIRLLTGYESASGPGARGLGSVMRDLGSGRVTGETSGHVLAILKDIEPLAGYAARHLWYGHAPLAEIDYHMTFAPAPNRDSRVTLGDARDALGMRRLVLDWKLSEIDFHTIRWVTTAFADQAAANGFGRSRVDLSDEAIKDGIYWTWHHMCTTRMSTAPSEGVVDKDCLIHGMKNLYVAGSSVFTTSGSGSPTFMIVALAQRLGDHLKRKMAA